MGFDEAIGFVKEAQHIIQLSGLIKHVAGEHLARFNEGVIFIEKLNQLSFNDEQTKAALIRSKAIFLITENEKHNISNFANSDQIRILAASASADVEQRNIERATGKFKTVLEMAKNLDENDEANRALAVAGHNLASAIEEMSELSDTKKELMLLAAHASRKYWQIAGTWLETERAEYYLAKKYLKCNDYISSIKHANLCLTICEKNTAEPLEFFFAYESIANVEKAMGQPLRSLLKMQEQFEKLSEADKTWCRASLVKFQ